MNEQRMNWAFVHKIVHTRTQKTPHKTDFIGHNNNSEVFPFRIYHQIFCGLTPKAISQILD